MAEDPSGAGPDDGDEESSEDDRFASIARADRTADPDDERAGGWGRDVDDGAERTTEASIPIDLDDDRDGYEGGDGESGDGADDPYAPEPNSTRIEPGKPKAENVLFVLLGAVAMLLVIARLATIFVGV